MREPDAPLGTIEHDARTHPGLPEPEDVARAARPARRLPAGLLKALLVAYFVAGLGLLVVRHAVLPGASAFRVEIAAALGNALGLPVSVAQLRADWRGLRPVLELSGVRIADAEGRNALDLERVVAVLAWSSLVHGRPVFARVDVFGPVLEVRRSPGGGLTVAGLAVGEGAGTGGAAAWLLDRTELRVHDATVAWDDALRGADPLILRGVELRLSWRDGRHRFGLRAAAPGGVAAGFELRGDLRIADPADWRSWQGRLYVALRQAELGAWQHWVDFPVPLRGRGDARLWFDLASPSHYAMQAELALSEVHAVLRDDLPALALTRVSGTLGARREGAAVALETRGLDLLGEGFRFDRLALSVDYRPEAEGGSVGRVRVPRLDLAALAALAVHLPFDRAALAGLQTRALAGELAELDYAWSGPGDDPLRWRVSGRASALSSAAADGWPGVRGLSASFAGDQDGGRYALAVADGELDLPKVFPHRRIALARLDALGGWSRDERGLRWQLERAEFENSDAAGSATGSYRPQPGSPGEIELEARLDRAAATAVWRYLPRVVDSDTRAWLQRALLAGEAGGARLALRGALAEFPFGGGEGLFRVTVPVRGLRLDYAPGWPPIDEIAGELVFEGPAMRIRASSARVGEVALAEVAADVERLDRPLLKVRGRGAGSTDAFLEFVNASPVAGWIGGFTHEVRARGAGELALRLELPLGALERSVVAGEYRFADNRLRLFPGLPALEQAAGSIHFSERGMRLEDARARLLGEVVAARGETLADGELRFHASGLVSAPALRRETDFELLDQLSGITAWGAEIRVREAGVALAVDSDLRGVASRLPAPLVKAADEALPLQLRLELPADERRQDWRVQLGPAIRFELARVHSPGGEWVGAGAGLAVNAPLRRAEAGLMAAIEMSHLDLDAWRALRPAGHDAAAGIELAGLALRAGRLEIFGETLEAVELRALADPGGWTGRLSSAGIVGEFDWRSRDQGALKARLERLSIGGPGADARGSGIRQAAEAAPSSLPALDVTAARFELRGMALGELSLYARNLGGEWRLDTLRLASPHGRIEGEGHWQPGASTELAFSAESDDIGAYLAGIGRADALSRGRGTLAGKLAWQGAPTEIDYPSLGGSLRLRIQDGQFRQLEPGVGRLLGVLSLQALPRRVTLDFRDVFSEGFAFDLIDGELDVAGGVISARELSIRGPAARVRLSGQVDLDAETQDLRVAVQPTLTESVAVGAALANAATGLLNPVAGLVTYIAQKVMQDPVEKIFAHEYAVTGGWDEPKVEKLAAQPTGAR